MTTEDRATRPTLHLTNLSSTKRHGPGRKVCAMANPGRFYRGDGRCGLCAPFIGDLNRVRDALKGINDAGQHRAAEAVYRGAFERLMSEREYLGRFRPGTDPAALSMVTWAGSRAEARSSREPLVDGDTLFCVCARPGSQLRRAPCHIELLPPFLVRAGWDVRIDGRLVTFDDCDCNTGPPHRGDGEIPCRGRARWAEGAPTLYRAEDFGWPEAT